MLIKSQSLNTTLDQPASIKILVLKFSETLGLNFLQSHKISFLSILHKYTGLTLSLPPLFGESSEKLTHINSCGVLGFWGTGPLFHPRDLPIWQFAEC